MKVLIVDEQLNGTINNQFEINIETEFISLKELIEKRVIQEVNNYNNKPTEFYNGLVEPTEFEKTLNKNLKSNKKKLIDAEKQVYVALNAFLKNGYFVLVDDVQIEELFEPIRIKKDSKISFIKLTPLIGG